MYPIIFENIYYDKIWGGRDFESFRSNLPEGMIGESWDIACHPNGIGIVKNGDFKGISFDKLIEMYGHKLVGEKISVDKFPLLVKLINSKEKLSVQVHPGDEYAKKYENEFGKTEAWYVIDAKPGASLIVGTKNCDKDTFEKAIEEGKVEDYLNRIEVKKGDCFLIDSGLVHAICEGVIIAEIQQNSDVTYRVFDYGRPREIHVEKSLDVMNFNLQCKNLSNNQEKQKDGYKEVFLCENEYFHMEKLTVDNEYKNESDKDRFYIYTVVDGEGEIISVNNTLKINKGDSIFIPATLGEFKIVGNITMLMSYAV
ncbi:mannose-6-phosphate isomerase, class I [Clostridium tertium]|uniref:mannose-6-phosphate isomerase n=1 Tax=Clostridium tertium TaxID=1559 RepID=A0A6N3B021_9CLOT